jgi:hypothetical protein
MSTSAPLSFALPSAHLVRYEQVMNPAFLRTLPLLVALLVLAGCNSTAPPGLPGGAVLIGEGDRRLSIAAPDNGTLYVRDLPADTVVYEGPVNKGQRIDLDAAAGRLTIDGRAVQAKPLRPDGTFQLFLKPPERREYHPMMTP